ncbi:c-type cytochrome biogenesis protein CcmI [Phenylobacterium sp.]|uniref:c-type cytochrome biogenesis protein CcmI n=1 Tax=Phenylobacterium sp. TaxID=1871053 RepID=UPI0025FE6F7D|nr:c-type cytochrome biogenesis protein CcmI [Phenylobacterium sp.]MBX3482460.1 c-type cytochrome biogenesis protein CcmI [Phenylobacterium sp.]MCW5760345.1 c-type cytochrome biogenesis protein CcmI [Phenylobacterium sp.]
MLLFWAVAGVLAAAAAGLILMRAAGAAGEAAAADPAPVLYKRQLSEIGDLVDRGLMGEAERKGAEAEAARRLLAASDRIEAPWSADPRARAAVLVAVCAAPALALGLYLKLGAAGLQDQPYETRVAAWQGANLDSLTPPQLAAVMRKVTSERPNDPEGLRLLGMVESASDNPIAAVRALRRAAQLAPGNADIWRQLGEAEVVAGGGKMGAGAETAFNRVLALSPGDAGARFYLARGKAEAGRTAEAVADLRGLLAAMPAGDPRRAVVEQEVARIEGRPAGPTADPQQLAMIRGMVASLAAKLEADPDNPDGWVRLVRAYAVLGDTAKRDAAYSKARAKYAGQPAVLQQLDEAARAETMR